VHVDSESEVTVTSDPADLCAVEINKFHREEEREVGERRK
jgi:hypothetical protein